MADPKRPGLEGIARAEGRGLDDAARSRVLEELRQSGPKTVRRARFTRRATRVGGGLLAAAAVFALSQRVNSPSRDDGRPMIARGDERPAEKPRPCADWSARTAEFVETESGPTLDLGPRALVLAEKGTAARLVTIEGCRLEVALDHGKVVVHARDLGGGEMQVTTPEGSVVVHGTIFSVEHRVDELTVDVAEGLVEVRAEESQTLVRPGDRVKRKRGSRARKSRIRKARVKALLDAVRREVASAAPSIPTIEPPSDLELDAETKGHATKKSKRRRKGRSKARKPGAPEPLVGADDLGEAEPSLQDLLAEAEKLRQAGDVVGARRTLSKAGARPGRDARAAWVRLARLELDGGKLKRARKALREYENRGNGILAPEAAWISVRIEAQAGKMDDAKERAEDLIERWPKTPQAQSARRWLAKNR